MPKPPSKDEIERLVQVVAVILGRGNLHYSRDSDGTVTMALLDSRSEAVIVKGTGATSMEAVVGMAAEVLVRAEAWLDAHPWWEYSGGDQQGGP